MNISAVLAFVLGANSVKVDQQYTIQEAVVEVKKRMEPYDLTQNTLVDIPFRVLRLKERMPLSYQTVNAVVRELIQEKFITSDCSLQFIEGPFKNELYGDLSEVDLNNVFYISQLRNQRVLANNGPLWRCGYLATFNAVAQQACMLDELPAGAPFLISHKKIGEVANELCDNSLKVEGVIEYLCATAKIRTVVQLLEKEHLTIRSTIELVNESKFVDALMLLKPDYYLFKVVEQLLGDSKPNIEDVFMLLSRAVTIKDLKVKKISRDLIDIVVASLPAEPVKRLISLIDLLSEQLSQLSKKDYSSVIKASLCLKGESKLKQACAIIFGVDPSCLKFHLTESTKDESSKVIYKELREELFNSIKDIHFCVEQFAEVRKKIKEIDSFDMYFSLKGLEQIDESIKMRVRLVRSGLSSKLKCILALLYTSNIEIQDVIDYIYVNDFREKSEVLSAVRATNHKSYSTAIRYLKEFDQTNVIKAITTLADLRSVEEENPEIMKIIELLDKGVHQSAVQAYSALKQLDREQVERNLQAIVLKTAGEELPLIDDEADRKVDLEVGRESVVTCLKKADASDVAEILYQLKKSYTNIDECVKLLRNTRHPMTLDACEILGADCWKLEEVIDNLQRDNPQREIAIERLKVIAKEIPHLQEYADDAQLMELCTHPALKLSKETIHCAGDFTGMGLMFSSYDKTPLGLTEKQRSELSHSDLCEVQAKAIADHFDREFVKKKILGGHYFICRTSRGGDHWILMSLINLPDFKPCLFIMDSLNGEITNDPAGNSIGTDTFLAFLYNKFLRKYENYPNE